MSDLVTALASSIGMLLFVGIWLVALGLGIFWPVMAFLAVRHLRGVRRELERLNEHMARIGVEADAGSIYTRTGPLNIR